jgi:LPXTG-motif cell wall-anchored protein
VAISIDLHSDPIHLATTTSDGRGAFTVTVRLPSREYCDHMITAAAPDGAGASVPIRIGNCTVSGQGNGQYPGSDRGRDNGGNDGRHDGNWGGNDQHGGGWSDSGSSGDGDWSHGGSSDGGDWSDGGSSDGGDWSDGGRSDADTSMLPDTGTAAGGVAALAIGLTAGGVLLHRRRRSDS